MGKFFLKIVKYSSKIQRASIIIILVMILLEVILFTVQAVDHEKYKKFYGMYETRQNTIRNPSKIKFCNIDDKTINLTKYIRIFTINIDDEIQYTVTILPGDNISCYFYNIKRYIEILEIFTNFDKILYFKEQDPLLKEYNIKTGKNSIYNIIINHEAHDRTKYTYNFTMRNVYPYEISIIFLLAVAGVVISMIFVYFVMEDIKENNWKYVKKRDD